jgi:hypothetical protein
MRTGLAIAFCAVIAAAGLQAAGPETWIPVRWDGGPATLELLEGTPFNCLLVPFAGDIKPFAAKARERGIAVIGLVRPGAEAAAVASAVADARLDGLALEGDFPSGFADSLQKALSASGSAAVVIPIAGRAAAVRKAAWPVLAVEGVAPGVGKIADAAAASATAGLWVDSNMWLARSFRLNATPPVVWVAHAPPAGREGVYLKSVADAEAAGGRWIVTLEDGLRAKLLSKDAAAVALWRKLANLAAFFAEHAEWRGFAPFGTVGIIFDPTGPNLDNSEEFLNLVARRQIPYRVIERAQLGAPALEGLRAVLAFDLAPPTEAERKVVRDFAAKGGSVLIGPSWGGAPKQQAYTVEAVEEGEVAVYKEAAPDPQSVARDLNDLLSTPDLGVSVFNAPSVLSYVSASGGRMLVQMVNYADAPADSLTLWLTQKCTAARLYVPGSAPSDLPLKRSGGRTEIVIPPLAVYGALLVE